MNTDKNKNSGDVKRELFKFGLTLAIVFSLLGVLCFWRGKGFYYYFLFLSVLFLLPALTVPRLLKPAHRVWMILTRILGWLTTRAILTLVFYVALTPIGVLGKLLGKRFLDAEMDNSKESYWIRREQREVSLERYERQY